MFFVSCVSHVFASLHCCLVVTCWERAELLALVVDVNCSFVTFPCGILICLSDLILYIPVKKFSVMSRREPVLSKDKCVLLKDTTQ